MPRTHQQPQLTNCAAFFEQNNPELRQMARQHFRSEKRDHTLQPTALVNEAFIRLQAGRLPASAYPKQFFAMASRAMQRILVEAARHRNTLKCGGKWRRVPLDDVDRIGAGEPDVLAIKMAIGRLTIHDAALAQVAELCFVRGFSAREAAALLGRGESTVRRDRRKAAGKLRQYLQASTAVS